MRARAGAPPRPNGLLTALVLGAAVSAVFYYRQNWVGQVGGPISVEKMLWLHYAITTWFVVPAFLVRQSRLARPLRLILGSFLASMLARGVAELWLIYVAFGWSPLYGISHDLFNIVLIAVLRRGRRRQLAGLDAFNADVRRFTAAIQLSMVAEIVFAALFYRMHVHEDAVYFASPTEGFAHINLLTRWVDVAVYAELGRFLWQQRRVLFRRAAPTAAEAHA